MLEWFLAAGGLCLPCLTLGPSRFSHGNAPKLALVPCLVGSPACSFCWPTRPRATSHWLWILILQGEMGPVRALEQSQPHYPHPTEVVVRVEDGKKSKKDKAKKKKKRSTSTSSSKSDSTDSRAKSKRRSNGKRKAPEGAHILGQKDIEELQQFRRQAEIQKIRNEVLASIPSGPGASSKSAPTAKPDEMPGDTTAEALSPKTKKVVLAQSRILGQDSVSKRLLTDEVVSWVDVKAQLSGQSAQDVKSLCAQICEHAPRNKGDCITKIMEQLQNLD